MGKPRRVDLGAGDQDRANKQSFAQPRLNPAQHFFTNPQKPSSTQRIALGALRGVNITDPATDDVLSWDGAFWIATATTGGTGITLPVTMPVHDLGTVTTSIISHSFSETSAHVLKMILATDTTLTFTNIPSRHIEFELDVTQDGTGGYELAFSSASAVIEGTPSVQSTASKQTVMIGQTHGTTTSTAVFDIFDTALRSAGGAADNLGNHTMTQDLNAASFDIADIVDIDFKAGGSEDAYIHSSGAGLQMKYATGDSIKIIEGTNLSVEFLDSDMYMATNDVRQVQAMYFALTTSSIAGISGALQTNVPSLSAHQFQISSNKRFEIIGATVQVTDAVLELNINPVYLDDTTDASITTPAANHRAVYYSSDQGAMVAKDSTGTIHNLEAAASTAYVASWSVYPAIQDVDMASFDIAHIVDLDFEAGGSDDAYIHSSGAGLQIKCATGDAITFLQGTDLMGKWDDNDLYMATNDIRDIQALYFKLTTSSIAGISGRVEYNVPSLSSHQFQIASNKRMEIIGATIDVASAIISEVNKINFDVGSFSISQSGSDAVYNVGTGSYHLIQTGGANQLTVASTTITVANARLDMTGSSIDNVDNLNFSTAGQSIQTGGAGITVVAPAGDNINLQVNSVQVLAVNDTIVLLDAPIRLRSYSDATRPTAASAGAGGIIWSSTDSKPIYSDGTNWRLFSDDSIT